MGRSSCQVALRAHLASAGNSTDEELALVIDRASAAGVASDLLEEATAVAKDRRVHPAKDRAATRKKKRRALIRRERR